MKTDDLQPRFGTVWPPKRQKWLSNAFCATLAALLEWLPDLFSGFRRVSVKSLALPHNWHIMRV